MRGGATADSATRHLERAKQYVAKGDEFYVKAADEIIAAMKEDTTLSYVTVGQRLGKSKDWCRQLVISRTNSEPDREFKVDWRRGSHATTEEIDKEIEKRVKDPEQATKIVAAAVKNTPTAAAAAIKQNPAAARAVADDLEAAQAVDLAEEKRREEAADRRRKHKEAAAAGIIDPDLSPQKQPWRHLQGVVNEAHRAWELWDDDLSWGLLGMDRGDDAAQHKLRDLEEVQRMLDRIVQTGRAYIARREEAQV